MTKKEYQVALSTESQIVEVGEVLAQAFIDDPLCVYTFPDVEERIRAFTWFFTASVREATLFHSVYTTKGHVDGAAVWLPPNAGELTPEQTEWVGFDQIEARFGTEPTERFNSAFDYFRQYHHQVMHDDTHWYLEVLGVASMYRGQSLASALLSPVLEQADRDGIPCYLETFLTRNVLMYEHLGFHVGAHGVEPKSQIPFWALRREPRSR